MRLKKIKLECNNCWTLFVDGASGQEGAGAGLLLIDPQGTEIAYALRFDFPASNNEAEYEALIAGLNLALKTGAKEIQVYGDSQLMVRQVNGSYDAKDPCKQQYRDKVRTLIPCFDTFKIDRIPRSQNKRADALSKLASSAYSHLTKEVLVEVLPRRSITEQMVLVVTETTDSWMTPIIQYLTSGELPPTGSRARSIRMKAALYAIKNGILYKKGYLQPWLRCVGPNQSHYILQEVHLGSCGSHNGPRSITRKLIRLGYFWPTMYRDAESLVQKCDKCQLHAPVRRLPQTELMSIQSPWPFYQWGIDIVGPFPEAPGRLKFLLVAVDYFTKWVEAALLATISGKNVLKFVWKDIVCRFGIPKTIISDNGKQFEALLFLKLMKFLFCNNGLTHVHDF